MTGLGLAPALFSEKRGCAAVGHFKRSICPCCLKANGDDVDSLLIWRPQ